jgi:two-component system LytT family response regulator
MTAALRVVIADDEPPARAVLRELLRGRDGVELCGEAGDGAQAIDAIRTARPDLVFLDIQLPDLDGFEVLSRLAPDAAPQIVFVTAYDEFAVRAFEVHAVDYLVKPFSDARFDLAFARARSRRDGRRGAATHVARILHELGEVSDPSLSAVPPGHFVVRAGRRSLLIGIDEVEWIEADGYYAALHVRGQTHLVRETMAALEVRLDRARFVRIHRSAIVNLRSVRQLRSTPAGAFEVVLHDGTRLDVSRSRRRPLALHLSGRG